MVSILIFLTAFPEQYSYSKRNTNGVAISVFGLIFFFKIENDFFENDIPNINLGFHCKVILNSS